MKTGRLIKFPRPGGDIHAYLYQEAGAVRASVYLLAPGQDRRPVHEVSGPDSEVVEAEVRAWIQAHFPRPS
jgi:hypothetical protein